MLKFWNESRVLRKFRRDRVAMFSLGIVGIYSLIFFWSVLQDLDPFTVNKLAASRDRAPVTLLVYSNFHSPEGRKAVQTYTRLKNQYGDKIRVAFKFFLNDKDLKNNQWLLVAQAAYAAHAQGFKEFWDYQKRLLKTKKWDMATLRSFAKKESLDGEKFYEDLMLKKHLSTVKFEVAQAKKLGITKAGTFVVNGKVIKDTSALAGKIDADLKVWAEAKKHRAIVQSLAVQAASTLKADIAKKVTHAKVLKKLQIVSKSGTNAGLSKASLAGLNDHGLLAALSTAAAAEKALATLLKRTAALDVKRSPIWGKEIPFLQRYNLDSGRQFAPPSSKHWFGTDRLGRDIFVRTLVGVHIAFKIGIVTALIACIIGLLMGSFSGYFGGWVDIVISWVYSVLSAIPYILLLILIAAMFKKTQGMIGIYVAFGIGFWIGPCRMIRGEVFKLKALEYVQAARALGHSDVVILFKHIMPNTLHLVFVYFSLIFVGAVKSEVILSFLGLGVKGLPSWGRMISDAKSEILTGFWWQMIAASVALFILVYAFNILTDALQDALDPKHTR